MTWEWEIAVYLWIAGIAGGAYFASFLANRFSGGKHNELVQLATYVGVPLVLLGSLLLVLDLGKPFRASHLFVGLSPSSWLVIPTLGAVSLRAWPPSLSLYPISPMSLGGWILLLYAVSGVVLIALWFAKSAEPTRTSGFLGRVASLLRPLLPVTEVLGWIAFILAGFLIAYTGVLLSATNQPLWAGALFLPALFVVSAIATGTATLLLLLILMGRQISHEFGQAGAILTIVEVVTLVAFLVTVPAGVLIAGPLSLWFWGGVVLIGLLVPFGLELWATRKMMAPLVLASTLCVLLGGLILRAVVVIGGQM